MEPPSARLISVRGFFYPYRGLKFLLGRPRLLTYVIIPFGINTLLYGAFVWFVGSRFGGWLERLLPQGDAWYWAALSVLLLTLFAAVLLLVVVYTFTLVGNLILAPFNDLLSEKVERVYTGATLEEPFSLGALTRDMARSLKAELGRVLFYGAGFLALLSLNLVPGLGTAAYGVAVTLYTLFFLGWEYFDYSMERWRLTFGDKRKVAFRNGATFLGFGAGAALMLIIPLLNFVAIPVCVAGATLLFCDLRRLDRMPELPPTPQTQP